METYSSPKSEAAVAVVKGVLGAIPYAGGLLAEVYNLYLNPLETRKQRWIEQVAEVIDKIQRELGTLPADLQQNEQFVSFLYQATMIALKNHQQEKLSALRAAIVSIVRPEAPSEDLSFQLLHFIDDLSVTHIRVLHCLSKHADQFSEYTALEDVLTLFQDLGEKIERLRFRAILHDLEVRFLIRILDVDDFPEFQSTQATLLLESAKSQPVRVTSLGEDFLRFIDESEV
jgi:hypothetical protein